jgi:hypothetical protein
MVMKKRRRSQALEISTRNLVELNTRRDGLVRAGAYIHDNVIALQGEPLTPEAVAKVLKIDKPMARIKMLAVARANLNKMIASFVKQGPGAPRMQEVRADAPIEDVIRAYDWYLGKCVRMAGRWNKYAITCSNQLKKLRRAETLGRTTPSPAHLDALRARWRQHNAG